MPNTTIKLPSDKWTFRSLSHEKINYKYFVVCDNCSEISEKETECYCGQKLKIDSKKNNFLVHFNVISQISHILCKNFDVIMNYLNRQHEPGIMSDIDDGNLYRTIREKNQNLIILPFTLNLDGAQVYKSTNKSLWPVQLYLNFLPPNIRFLRGVVT